MNEDLYKRLARAEAMTEFQRAELLENVKAAFERAKANENAEDAAFFARKLRDLLLKESDPYMGIDRLGLTVPSGTTFSAWLGFFRTLGGALTGEWAQYRRALRDITDQPGFPLGTVFPEKPED
ncbi:MAG: hypothetical protein J5793_04995 [Clostridia bacterium]|nr:hypothetical protein [Clostridia bacterium]